MMTVTRQRKKRPANSEYANTMCYHENMSRCEAEETLAGLPPGAFVLRDSYEFPNDLALSLVSLVDSDCQVDRRPKKEMIHYRIDTTNGYRVRGPNEKTFPSLQSLLKHYTEAQHGLKLQLQIPIICNAMFHMVSVWEYQKSSRVWEPFTLEQMLTMSTLGGAEENYTATFDDHTSVNLKSMLRILPCQYTPSQKIRYRQCYAFCEECSNNRRSDTNFSNINIEDTNFCSKFRNCSLIRTTPSKYRYIQWEYFSGDEWTPLRPSVQKLLMSYHILWSTKQYQKDNSMSHILTVFDDHTYSINLRQNKVTVRGSEVVTIRKREFYGLSTDDLHHEKSNFLKMKNMQGGKRTNYLHRVYCNTTDSLPSTWEKSPSVTSHIFPSSAEYNNVCSRLPEACHKRIRFISRIQRQDLWRLYTKERKLTQLRLGESSVREEIMWSRTSLQSEADVKSQQADELIDTLTTQGVHYFRKYTDTDCQNPLILCKVLLESLPPSETSEEHCIVDDIHNPSTVQMSSKVTDRVYPLYLVFFNEGDNNTTNTMIEKTFDKR